MQSKIKGNYLYKVECIQDNKVHHAMSNLRSGYTAFWTLVIDGSPKKSSHIVNIEVNYRFIDSKNILSLITRQLFSIYNWLIGWFVWIASWNNKVYSNLLLT